jgi:predicted phage baseplate assembly protein
MNEVPRKTYLKFAQLLGLELSSAKPATVRLVFTPKAAESPDTIKQGSRYSAKAETATVIFETTQALDIIGAPLAAMFVFADGTITRADLPPLPDAAPFWPLGRDPAAGDALYLAFKPNPNNPSPFPRKMRFLVLRPAEDTDGLAQRIGEQERDLIPPVELAWEYRPKADQDAWEQLSVFKDESVALTRDGYIEVEGPQQIEPSAEPSLAAQLPGQHYWLRVRLDQNRYPAGRAPRLDHFLPNAVDAVNLSTEARHMLGSKPSSGRAEQSFDFPKRPVDAPSLKLEIELPGGAVEKDWSQVDDFFASGPHDKHFVLNATAGRVSFGDGSHGQIPAAGATIVAAVWRQGGGAAGNKVAAGAVKTMISQVAGIEKVINPRKAAGGADEQTLNDFIRDAPAQLRSGKRVVTARDFEVQATAIDGVKKAKALGGRHPDYPDVELPGTITVLIVADSDRMPPKPSAELIRSVCRTLEQVRLITTEVYVAAPQFIEVRIEARLLAEPDAAFDQVANDARKRLDEFLNPLQRRFGENISAAALYATLFGPTGSAAAVRSVENMVVYVDGREHDVRRPIDVRADSLVYPGRHLIVVQPDPTERVAR